MALLGRGRLDRPGASRGQRAAAGAPGAESGQRLAGYVFVALLAASFALEYGWQSIVAVAAPLVLCTVVWKFSKDWSGKARSLLLVAIIAFVAAAFVLSLVVLD